jgi:hypothetical protein
VLERKLVFKDLLIGPQLQPRITIDIASGSLIVEGERVEPSGCFIRHDVFLAQKTGSSADCTAALNWFYAIRGWSMANSNVRLFNRTSYLSENNKIENLRLALNCGLEIPDTVVTNDFSTEDSSGWIQKPVAGGSFTTTLDELLNEPSAKTTGFPRFLQRRMQRPELRVYRVGPSMVGFTIASPDLDYRQAHRAVIELTQVPPNIAKGLFVLTDKLGLDFAAADFMHDETGNLRFLEVNTQPMFAAFDRVANGAISDAIIDFLSL